MPSTNKEPSTSSSSSSSKSTSATAGPAAAKGPGSQGGSGVSPDFARSYGLKYQDPEDYAEAKAIQQAFRDQDAKEGKR